jgi:hypothetical protein
MDDRETREVLLRLLHQQREEQRRAAAHSQRGKTCPIQRPGLKR